MKIGIYDPYLDTMGGAERYLFALASCLQEGNTVSFFWDPRQEVTIKQLAKERFALDASFVHFTQDIFSHRTSLIDRYFQTRSYDVIFYISDGSIPFLFSKNNILIFQFPVNWVNGKSIVTALKMNTIHHVICYSAYVKAFIDTSFGVNAKIIAPSVAMAKEKVHEKENLIVSVGRFTRGKNTKKQDIMIDAFKKLQASNKGWKLLLIGSHLPTDTSYVEELKQRAKGYPITIQSNVSYEELTKAYQKAKIYWHAAGYGEDLVKHPENAEHFGITTVEAMRKGVVPIVIAAGGQKEIVTDGYNGYLWHTIDELIVKTKEVMTHRSVAEKLAERARQTADRYTPEVFCEAIKKIVA